MMEKLNVTTILVRVKAETPKFWKKIRTLMITAGVVGGTLIALPKDYIIWLPENVPGMFITIGAVGTALASLTVQDKKEEVKKQEIENS